MLFLSASDPRRQVWEACESPLEQALCCALFALLGCRSVSGPFGLVRVRELGELAGGEAAAFLFAQHTIGVHRVDFLIVAVDPRARLYRRLAIECDASDEQAIRERRRDEWLECLGYPVVRYTAAAIHGRMREIVDQLGRWIEAGGAACHEAPELTGYARLLSAVLPDPAIEADREAARRAYWEAEAAAEGPDFEFEGAGYRWADTI
jgi:hypothetical protein